MRLSLLLFVCILAGIITGCNTEKPVALTSNINREEIQAFLKTYDDAWSAKNVTGIDSLLGASYTYFTSTGKLSKRSDALTMLAASYYRLLNANRSEVEIFIDGNTAVVSSRWKGNGTWKGTAFNDDQRCGLIIQKQSGQLKLITEHCVQIAKDSL